MINIGLIGFGYWGPNLARNFNNNPDFNLAAICDFSADRLEAAGNMYHHLKLTKQPDEIFKDHAIDAVAVATPVFTHFDLAKQALMNDKHVWLELDN